MSVLRVLLIAVLAAPTTLAQPPEKFEGAPKNDSQKRAEEARKQFGLAVLLQKQGVFLSAMKAAEEALKLDPDAVPPRRLLAKLYDKVGRPDDAIVMAQSVVERNPADFDDWQTLSQLLHGLGRADEARVALSRGTECESAAKYPQQHLVMLNRLGAWSEKASDFKAAESAARRFVQVLETHRDRFINSSFLSEEDFRSEKADGYERIGRAALGSGHHDAALSAFEQARQVFADRTDAVSKARTHRLHWHLAQVESARGDASAAIGQVQEYLRHVKPGRIEPYRFFAEQFKRLGNVGEGAKRLEAYALRDKDNLPLQLLTAEQIGAAGRFEHAQDFYLNLLKIQVKPEIYGGLFLLYERNGRMPLVLSRLDEHASVLDKDKERNEKTTEKPREHVRAMMAVLAKHPSMVRQLVPLADEERFTQMRQRNLDYNTFERLASLLVRWEDLAGAERLLRESLQRPNRIFRASSDEALLRVLSARRKYADIKSLCEDRLNSVEDNKFLYHYYLDTALAKVGNIQKALEVNEQAVELAFSEGNKFNSRMHRVDILVQGDRSDEALKECDKLLKDFPGARFGRDAQIKSASILSHLRRHEESEQVLRRLLEQDPNDARVCNFLGFELAERNRKLDEAEQLVRRALELDRRAKKFSEAGEDETDPFDQESAAYLDSLAWVLFRKGKLADARQIMEKALAQPDGRDEAALWDHLGDICYRQGDSAKARWAWESAVKFYQADRLPKQDGRPAEVARKLMMLNPK